MATKTHKVTFPPQSQDLRGSSRWGNTPVVFERMQLGWSQPGQAPGTAGDPHTQTACLTTGAWPGLGLQGGPPQGPG